MAGNLLGVPIGATRIAAKGVAEGGRFVRDRGEDVANRLDPSFISQEVRAAQTTLQQGDVRRFGVIGLSKAELETGDEEEIVDQAYIAAQAMVEEGLIDENTAVELRPLYSYEDLRDPKLVRGIATAKKILEPAIVSESDSVVIRNSEPIWTPNDENPATASETTWQNVSAASRALSLQFREDPALKWTTIGVTSSEIGVQKFQGREFEPQHLEHLGLVVLRHVGNHPMENIMWPAHTRPRVQSINLDPTQTSA